MIALDDISALSGYTYLVSSLAGAGVALSASIQLLMVRVVSPMDASEGCADFHLRTDDQAALRELKAPGAIQKLAGRGRDVAGDVLNPLAGLSRKVVAGPTELLKISGKIVKQVRAHAHTYTHARAVIRSG